MSTIFNCPHVDSDVTFIIKMLLGIQNEQAYENLASLPTTLLAARGLNDQDQYLRVFAQLSIVNRGLMSAEDFVAWFDAMFPGDGVWLEEPEAPLNAFATTIKERRAQLGLTRTQLACRVGVAPSQVSRWENGGGMPRDATLVQLGSVLGYEPSHLWALANGGGAA